MIARRTLAWRPMSTPAKRIESSTSAKLLMRTSGPRIERCDAAAGDDRARADDAVQGAAAAVLLGEDELRRRHVGLIGADRPVLVVHVQVGIDGDQVHVGLVVGVERAHVAPVGVLLAVLVAERVGEDPVAWR